jgi:hypothetical protein
VGVDGGGCGAEGDPDGAAEESEQNSFGEELGADGLLVAPRARRRPISERRSRTEMIMMLATPTAPTRRATAPRPRNRLLRALLASAWATRAAEGWLTLTSLGFSGLAVAARRSSTALTRSFWARR